MSYNSKYTGAEVQALLDKIETGGGATPRIEMTEATAELEPNKFYVWDMPESLDLTLGAETSGVMNRYLFQFRNPKDSVTMLTLPDDVTWSEDTELDENGMPVMEATAFYRIEIIEGLASLKKWKLAYIVFADAEVESVLMANGVGDGIGITKKDAAAVTSIGTWFTGNAVVETFNELAYFLGIAEVGNDINYNQVFKGCTALREITMPANATAIYRGINASYGMCNGCTSLQKVYLMNVKSIGAYAFYNCASLSAISCKWEDVIHIGAYAFGNCSSLVLDSLSLVSLTSLEKNAFLGVKVKMLNLPSLLTLPAVSRSDQTYGDKTTLEEVVLSEDVTVIPAYSFDSCTALRSINLDNIVTINADAFRLCAALAMDVNMPLLTGTLSCFQGTGILSLILPAVSIIGDYACAECPNLHTVDLGEDVTAINQRAFLSCSSLTTMICRATTPPTLGSVVFGSTPIASGSGVIYVPDDSVEAYKAATNWIPYSDRIKPLSEYVEE